MSLIKWRSNLQCEAWMQSFIWRRSCTSSIPPPELREKYEHVNVGGTATVVEAAIKAGVKRVVLFSTIAVYGQSGGHVLNEMSPTHPDTFYAQTKLAAEQIVLNAKGADGQPLGTVLRFWVRFMVPASRETTNG